MRVSSYPPAAADRYLRCIARLIDAQARGEDGHRQGMERGADAVLAAGSGKGGTMTKRAYPRLYGPDVLTPRARHVWRLLWGAQQDRRTLPALREMGMSSTSVAAYQIHKLVRLGIVSVCGRRTFRAYQVLQPYSWVEL